MGVKSNWTLEEWFNFRETPLYILHAILLHLLLFDLCVFISQDPSFISDEEDRYSCEIAYKSVAIPWQIEILLFGSGARLDGCVSHYICHISPGAGSLALLTAVQHIRTWVSLTIAPLKLPSILKKMVTKAEGGCALYSKGCDEAQSNDMMQLLISASLARLPCCKYSQWRLLCFRYL